MTSSSDLPLHERSRAWRALHFLDLLEDDGAKFSVTKLGVWATTIFNIVTIASQTDWKIMTGAGMANIAAMVKHEFKRNTEAP